MYEGPRRPADEVAFIETDGTHVTDVDGEHRGDHGEVAVLPGLHAVSVRLDDHALKSGPREDLRWTTRSLTVCFVARAGRTYVVRPAYVTGRWRPEIVDQTAVELVDTDAMADPARGCGTSGKPYWKYDRRLNLSPLLH